MMSSTEVGAGVRRFREARARGDEPDAAALAREYPDEALDIAAAVRWAAARDDSIAREQMWLARAAVLSTAGEDVTLGAMLRAARNRRGLSIRALVDAARERGASLHPMAVEQLEANQAPVGNVAPGSLVGDHRRTPDRPPPCPRRNRTGGLGAAGESRVHANGARCA